MVVTNIFAELIVRRFEALRVMLFDKFINGVVLQQEIHDPSDCESKLTDAKSMQWDSKQACSESSQRLTSVTLSLNGSTTMVDDSCPSIVLINGSHDHLHDHSVNCYLWLNVECSEFHVPTNQRV